MVLYLAVLREEGSPASVTIIFLELFVLNLVFNLLDSVLELLEVILLVRSGLLVVLWLRCFK